VRAFASRLCFWLLSQLALRNKDKLFIAAYEVNCNFTRTHKSYQQFTSWCIYKISIILNFYCFVYGAIYGFTSSLYTAPYSYRGDFPPPYMAPYTELHHLLTIYGAMYGGSNMEAPYTEGFFSTTDIFLWRSNTEV